MDVHGVLEVEVVHSWVSVTISHVLISVHQKNVHQPIVHFVTPPRLVWTIQNLNQVVL
jgi:hypothetical protein